MFYRRRKDRKDLIKNDDVRSMYRGYEIIEQDWDRFYIEYPHIYDRFAISSIHAVHKLHAMFGFTGTRVLDIGSGTGKSTFEIAKYADYVVGVEPWVEMRAFAINQQERLDIRNVAFIDGTGESLPAFEEDAFNHAVSVYGIPILWEDATRRQGDCDAFIRSCHRVVKSKGYIIVVATTPDWTPDHRRRTKNPPYSLDDLLGPHEFTHRDVTVVLDYGSVEEALRTYGFIFWTKGNRLFTGSPDFPTKLELEDLV
jgi:ubiquinone/menaquinone biosynthesis C-methylase UbiE